MFTDRRSKKIVLVAQCILNQNAKIDGCAHYPGAIEGVAEVLIRSGCGIVQLPCPEVMRLGLDRGVDKHAARTIESEDTRVWKRMSQGEARMTCREIAEETVYQVQEYVNNGFEVCGMIGINGSPTCGVEVCWEDGQEVPGFGIFIQELDKACQGVGFNLRFKGIRASEPSIGVTVARMMLIPLE